MASPLPGRVSLTVSTPSGQSCTIAALASGRVDQLHVAIERALKIPRVVQRLICEGREIYSKHYLAELRLEDGSIITVVNGLATEARGNCGKVEAGRIHNSNTCSCSSSSTVLGARGQLSESCCTKPALMDGPSCCPSCCCNCENLTE